MIRLCGFEGNLGCLWLASGCGSGSEMNDTSPPEEVDACEGYTTPYNESPFPGELPAMMATTTT